MAWSKNICISACVAAGKCTPRRDAFLFIFRALAKCSVYFICVHAYIAFSPESAEAASSRRKRVKRGAAKKSKRARGVVGREERADGEKGELSGWWVVEEEALIKMIHTRLGAQ
jgi:hypothetical protein